LPNQTLDLERQTHKKSKKTASSSAESRDIINVGNGTDGKIQSQIIKALRALSLGGTLKGA